LAKGIEIDSRILRNFSGPLLPIIRNRTSSSVWGVASWRYGSSATRPASG